MAGSRSSAEDQDAQASKLAGRESESARERAKEAADALGGLSGEAAKSLGDRKQKLEDAIREAGG